MTSTPHITVAAVIERDGEYLLVKEWVNNQIVFNQPAGHWEVDESLIEAVVRETLEETAWDFKPQAITGIYRWPHPEKDEVFIRVTFCGQVTHHYPEQPLDDVIIETCWMTRQQIAALHELDRRSAMVLKSIDDYEAGKRFDLDLLCDVIEHWD